MYLYKYVYIFCFIIVKSVKFIKMSEQLFFCCNNWKLTRLAILGLRVHRLMINIVCKIANPRAYLIL